MPDPPAAKDWASRLVRWTSALLLFETVTGLSIHLLPFSVPNQVAVLLHTLVGLPLLLPAAVYGVRHWLAYRDHQLTHTKLTGYVALAALALLVVSGLVLTWQAALAARIDYSWRTAHAVATYVLVASLAPHVVLLIVRAARSRIGWAAGEPVRRFAVSTTVLTAVGCLAWAGWSLVDRPPATHDAFPEGYGTPYGEDRPFAPSLARTAAGGA